MHSSRTFLLLLKALSALETSDGAELAQGMRG